MQESETGGISINWMQDNWNLNDEGVSLDLANYPFKFPHADTNVGWQRAVEQYSQLQLTYASDRLPAIAALVERTMKARKHDIYVSGMWKSSLLHDLAWSRADGEYSERSDDNQPTWSWASISVPVRFTAADLLPSTELVKLDFTPVGPPHVGEVRNASISLRGKALPTTLQYASHDRSYIEQSYYKLVPKLAMGFQLRGSTWWHLRHDSSVLNVDDSFSILFLWQDSRIRLFLGLLLRKISDTTHERVGLAQLRDCAPYYPKLNDHGCPHDPPLLKTGADLIKSLPIKEFEVV